MGKHSQTKGKRFEAKIAELIGHALSDWLVRNLNQTGEDAGRDLLTRVPLCIQCQHSKKIDPYGKLLEAKSAARPGELSVAILQQDYKPIIAVLSLADLLELLKKAYG